MDKDSTKYEKREGKSVEELEKEIHRLKTKLKFAKCRLQQTRSEMELQGLRTRQLVLAWQTRLDDAKEKTKKYEKMRDRELGDINSQLLFLQGQLRKEQTKIQTEMSSKNKIIVEQNNAIQKLKTENKKLIEILVVSGNKGGRLFQSLSNDLEISLDTLTDSGIGSKHMSVDSSREFIEFQKAFDTIRRKHNTTTSFTSHDDINSTVMSDFVSDPNITQDDVFVKDENYQQELSGSFPDLVMNTGITDKSPKITSETVSHHNIALYANPKLIRKEKKKKKKKKHTSGKVIAGEAPHKFRSRHMSIDFDISFDSVEFDNGNTEENHWYSDDQNTAEDVKKEKETPAEEDMSVHSFDRRQGGSFFRDIFNTLRHKTVRIKRKRSKSLSSNSKMPVIFLTQSVPDIPNKEINIDEAIAKKRKTKSRK